MVKKSSSPPAGKGTLGETLKKNTHVADEVQRASQHLSVVNTVLEQELPPEVQVGDVARAIAHTGEIEKKLADSVEKLAEVNAALAEEIEKRIEATDERDESREHAQQLQARLDDAPRAAG